MKSINNKSRKSIVLILSVAVALVVLVFFILKPATIYEEEYDVTGDGLVDMYDFKLCLLTESLCDFNGDGIMFDEADMELMWHAIERHESNAFTLFPLSVSGYSCSDADLNGDGVVNALDLAIFGQQYGECGDYVGDINGDGCVNYDDQIIMAVYFGQTCTSSTTSTTAAPATTSTTLITSTTSTTVYVPSPCDVDEIYINNRCVCKSSFFRFSGECYPHIYIYIAVALVGVVAIVIYTRR